MSETLLTWLGCVDCGHWLGSWPLLDPVELSGIMPLGRVGMDRLCVLLCGVTLQGQPCSPDGHKVCGGYMDLMQYFLCNSCERYYENVHNNYGYTCLLACRRSSKFPEVERM
jgi:hypothetical protein